MHFVVNFQIVPSVDGVPKTGYVFPGLRSPVCGVWTMIIFTGPMPFTDGE